MPCCHEEMNTGVCVCGVVVPVWGHIQKGGGMGASPGRVCGVGSRPAPSNRIDPSLFKWGTMLLRQDQEGGVVCACGQRVRWGVRVRPCHTQQPNVRR